MIDNISQELTPMVATARSIKQEHPNAKVVFIGPCAAKKLEASRRSVRSDVDFVITFEELVGMFDAKGIDMGEKENAHSMHDAHCCRTWLCRSRRCCRCDRGMSEGLLPGCHTKNYPC